jgi:hypothetical protein
MTSGVRALALALVLLAAGGGAARATDECKVGKLNDYILWFDDITEALGHQEIIERALQDLRADIQQALAPDEIGISSVRCTDKASLDKLSKLSKLEKLDPKLVQGFLDHAVLMGIVGGRNSLEYLIVPYLSGPGQPVKLESARSCGGDHAGATDELDRLRIQAYGAAALALYEVRLLESGRDPCVARRAEVLIQRAISKVDEVRARVPGSHVGDDGLRLDLSRTCQRMEGVIDQIGTSNDRCPMPAAGARLAKLAGPLKTSVCGRP